MTDGEVVSGAFRIRPVGRGYATKMAALHAQCFAKGWSALEFESFFERSGVFAGIAYGPDQQAVGFVLCWVIEDVCDLLSLGVAPDYRREGLGLMLLDYAEATARDHAAARMMLEVNIRNEAAIAMYEGRGYVRDGLRKSYYSNADGTKSDALRMVKAL